MDENGKASDGFLRRFVDFLRTFRRASVDSARGLKKEKKEIFDKTVKTVSSTRVKKILQKNKKFRQGGSLSPVLLFSVRRAILRNVDGPRASFLSKLMDKAVKLWYV